MRFATLGLFHEANTFSPFKADKRLFEDGGVFRGDEIIAEYDGSATPIGGYLEECRRRGAELVPLLQANVTPVGAITEDAFESLVGEMLEQLRDRGPWDGVLLNIHGAAVAEHIPDADGEIAARVRQIVGPDVPVGAVLDMHANVSEKLVEALTITLVYQTNPHVDAREKAVACTKLVLATAEGTIKPEQALVQLPLVVNIARQDTSEPPMSELVEKAQQLENGLLSVSVVEGFPYADVPQMGMSCIAISDGDAQQAEAAAQELADEVWRRRGELQARGTTVDEALDIAEREQGPVVLLDVGDNIGGGAPGDSTVILEAAIARGGRSLVQTLWDAESVRQCGEAGVGATVTLEVGTRNVPVTGVVKALSDGRFEEPKPTHGGYRFFDMGPAAVIETDAGHTLVLSTKAILNSSLQQLLSVGVDPSSFQIVVAKGVNSPRAAYGPIAKRMIVVDTDGVTAMGLERFTYQHRRKPMFPFETGQ
ncbi:M81 family metallopeptidase [Amycolatopsis sp. GM8]|uniref:M81 family metallopeptidase n=1 Tax=Amycolatopsis sp. GM8 TaxID=2896530 RepID=UPI001F1A930F|nr:M81 family metallopeptidase [Amycolatopsis sp. GM8]